MLLVRAKIFTIFKPCQNPIVALINFVASFTQVNYLELVYTAVSEKFSSPSSAVGGKTSDAANKGGQNPETNTETSLLGSLLG